MPEWMALLIGLAAVVLVARLVLRLFSRWWLWLVGAVLLVVVLQAGGIPGLI